MTMRFRCILLLLPGLIGVETPFPGLNAGANIGRASDASSG